MSSPIAGRSETVLLTARKSVKRLGMLRHQCVRELLRIETRRSSATTHGDNPGDNPWVQDQLTLMYNT